MNIFVSIFILAFALSAKAGVESVGNGGGFAEMQAYAVDRRIPQVLNYCLGSQNICRLNFIERELASEFLQRLMASSRDLLKINESCDAPFVHQDIAGSVSLDACSLYLESVSDFGPIPISDEKISEKVIGVRLLEVFGGQNWSSLANKLGQAFQFEDEQSVVAVNGYHFRLHVWKINLGSASSQAVTVGTLNRSWDVGTEIEKNLQCSGKAEFQLSGFQFLGHPMGTTGKSPIQWSCQGQNYRATLYLDLVFSGSELQDIQMNLFGKEPL